MQDGKKRGQGTYTWSSEGKWAGEIYVGEWADGERNGQGTMTYADGDVYEGEWRDDKKHRV